MYTKKIPFKDYKGKPRNEEHYFMLEMRDVFKLMVELQAMFKWQDSIRDENLREVPTEEVVEFYNNLETVLLSSWGIPSEDGRRFLRGGRYDFEDSKPFAELMKEFVMDPPQGTALLDGIMPEGMEEIVRKADELEAQQIAALAKAGEDRSPAEIEAQIAELRGQLATKKDSGGSDEASEQSA